MLIVCPAIKINIPIKINHPPFSKNGPAKFSLTTMAKPTEAKPTAPNLK